MSYTSFVPRTGVAQALYARMQKRGLTVCQVARLCDDLTCQEVVDLLYGRIEVTPERALALADGFDTTAEYWLRLSDGSTSTVP